jgi:hypothetical protein
LISDGSGFWYDVEWSPVMRWVEHDPERLAKHEATQPIGDYYMFAVTGGGDPWCWDSGVPTSGDEFEIHEVDLFMYLPRAVTFEGFMLRKHLEGIVHCEHLDYWDLVTRNCRVLEALLSPDALTEVRSIERRVHDVLVGGNPNPFRGDDFYAVIERRLGSRYGNRQ